MYYLNSFVWFHSIGPFQKKKRQLHLKTQEFEERRVVTIMLSFKNEIVIILNYFNIQ